MVIKETFTDFQQSFLINGVMSNQRPISTIEISHTTKVKKLHLTSTKNFDACRVAEKSKY